MTSPCSHTATSGADINRLYLTNNYSIISKYSAIKSGYFKDEPLTRFVEDFLKASSWRRTPLINRGYSARLMALDWIVGRSVTHGRIDCAIILGSGFDMTPVRRMGECIWIEIDLPQVIDVKCQYFEQKLPKAGDILKQADNTIISFPSLGIHMISCDLMDTNQLALKLKSLLATIGHQIAHVALINEVCLCYLEDNHIANILRTVIQTVQAPKVSYIGYEQVRPASDAGGHQQQMAKFMIDHFKALGHDLKYFPTEDQVKGLLVDQLGFDHITIVPMYQLFHNALLDYRKENSEPQLEPFDEYEEMDLYLSHYALVMGSHISDPMSPFKQQPNPSHDFDQLMDRVGSIVISGESDGTEAAAARSSQISFLASPQITRYGHSSCVLTDTMDKQETFITGGFGVSSNGQHRRLSSCALLSRDLKTGANQLHELNCNELNTGKICLDRVHGQVCHLGDGLLFFSGGRHSPSSQDQRCSAPFVAKMMCQQHDDGSPQTAALRVVSDANFDNCNIIRWRHKMLPLLQSHQVVQVGGLSGSWLSQARIMWDLGRWEWNCVHDSSERSLLHFNRHSFGMDRVPDSDTIVIHGGLTTLHVLKDLPVARDLHTVLWDTRQVDSFGLGETPEASCCYGADIHFVSSHQFIRLGGISTKTGLNNQTVELFDLRSLSQPVSLATVPPEAALGDSQSTGDPLILTNATSEYFKQSGEVVTYGGGGNYFTFGTHFNRSHLIYKHNNH